MCQKEFPDGRKKKERCLNGAAKSLIPHRNAVLTIIKLSAPLLGVALIVGLAISIFRQQTQIRNRHCSFVPKIIAVFFGAFPFWRMDDDHHEGI